MDDHKPPGADATSGPAADPEADPATPSAHHTAAPPPDPAVGEPSATDSAPPSGADVPPVDIAPPPAAAPPPDPAVGEPAATDSAPPPGSDVPPVDIAPPPTMLRPPAPGMTVPTTVSPKRPGPIIATMVLLWVQVGLAALLAAFLGLLLMVRLADADGDYGDPGVGALAFRSGISASIMLVMTLLFFAVLMTIAAILLLKRADLARTLTIAVMGFFLFSNLTLFVFLAVNTLLVGVGDVANIVILAFLLLVAAVMPATILVLLSLKKSVTWFYDKSAIG